MDTKKTTYTVRKLVDSWNDSSLKRNDEYQRGASWSLQQKQGLVDSIFRKYPIPPIFLHRIASEGLEGPVVRFEVVDGQQRIRALASFLKGEFQLLPPEDKRLRLPASLRKAPAPWGGRNFSQLDGEQKRFLQDQEIDVFVINAAEQADEVRDLFIRLQSGTALSRQQIRDAWPGTIGPAVEALAGKLERQPSCALFRLVDKRGARNDDDKDAFVSDRQFCAQLLTLFLARERDPLAAPGIGVAELDALYHENTTLDTAGEGWTRFCTLLSQTASLVDMAGKLSALGKLTDSSPVARRKFRKIDVVSLFMFLQDLTKSPLFKLDSASKGKLAGALLVENEAMRVSRSTEGSEVRKYYEEWRKRLGDEIGIRRDPKRLFDDAQRAEIWTRDGGNCHVCHEGVTKGDDEYDHTPIPWRDGGQTVVGNGRLVHKACHERGQHSPD